jgi:isoquinoline 1-oxidoreductase beta subunit
MPASDSLNRRAVLRSLLLGSAWLLGPERWVAAADSAPTPGAEGAAEPPPRLTPWLRFEPDGQVLAYTNVADIGQGTWAALRMAVAHQLALPFNAVRIVPAPVDTRHFNLFTRNYATFGSLGLRSGVATLAPAAALARTMLEQAAALRWGIDAALCTSRDGRVAAGERSLAFAELLQDAARLPVPDQAPLREGVPPPPPQADRARERVNGQLRYGIDHRLPGQRFAATQHAPRFGAQLITIRNEAAVRRLPGVLQIVRLAHAVAVVAVSSWQALQAAQALQLEWSAGRSPQLSGASLREQLRAAAQRGEGVTIASPREPAFNAEATAAALAGAAQTVDLLFDVPFLAHLPMEPLNATARVDATSVEVWVSTQSASDTRAAVARHLQRPLAQVQIHPLVAGGGFGRRLEHDWVLEAVSVAAALPGQPVQLLWPRQTELRAGHFRPAVAARVRVALDADGAITALRTDSANPALIEHTGLVHGPTTGPDWTVGMGWRHQPYAIPALHLTWTRVDPGVPCAYWRSVGASQNHFFCECALDVAARRSGQSPLALRERLLAQQPRALAFLRALARLGGWDAPLPPGHFRGLAMGAANGSLSGHVVEIEWRGARRFRLVQIAAAIDAGAVHDRSAVEGQLMGGTVFGLSAALEGEVQIEAGGATQSNFHDHPVLRMAELPPLTLAVLPSSAPAGGVGEEGVPTIAPAIANALFAATGETITRLPLARAGWTQER